MRICALLNSHHGWRLSFFSSVDQYLKIVVVTSTHTLSKSWSASGLVPCDTVYMVCYFLGSSWRFIQEVISLNSLNISVLSYPEMLLINYQNARSWIGRFKRNLHYFRGTSRTLIFINITKHTYIRIWTVTKIKTLEKCGILAVPRILRV